MDFLYISPEFPPNYANFIYQLSAHAVRVWGIGETDFYSMPSSLRSALTWYARSNLKDPAAVKQAVDVLMEQKRASGYPGAFDMVESHNEQWLNLEGMINDRYGIDGIGRTDLPGLKKKSHMKRIFVELNMPVARGAVVADAAHAYKLAGELGYPLILKPDEGVGAGGIYRVEDELELNSYLAEIEGDYLLEEFVEGDIVTYDGLTDYDGNILFENSLTYGDGVLDYVLGKDTFFYVSREIPAAVVTAGRQLVSRFGIRRKFFHFEFFKTGDTYRPIEINCRPPGGAILDMMNYSVDDDLYRVYADMIIGGPAAVQSEKKYYCCYIGRKDKRYLHGHDEISDTFGPYLVEHGLNPEIYRQAMGTERYILRSPDLHDILEMGDFILKKR
jgi:hypothetical protein